MDKLPRVTALHVSGGLCNMEFIKSRQNPKIQRVKKLGSDRTFRRREGVFVCDGEKLLFEAVKNGAGIETVFTWDESLDLYGFTGDVYAVDRELLELSLIHISCFAFLCAHDDSQHGGGHDCNSF